MTSDMRGMGVNVVEHTDPGHREIKPKQEESEMN